MGQDAPRLNLRQRALLSAITAALLVNECALAKEPPIPSTDGPTEADAFLVEDEPFDTDVDDLLAMDIDELMQVEVIKREESVLDDMISSVSRTDVSVRKTPSAVYVVTQDMIHRSGARNVMEVLRTVPGVHVARSSASTWAISIRGFNGAFTDKLLVQIDGRAVYNVIFGGTLWEYQLVPLKDVERIEVVRGPGGTVWGSNAVNGVINIVTKDSQDTVGLYGEAGGGDVHRSFSHARIGGCLGENATYRVYGMQFEDDNGFPYATSTFDSRRGAQGGFRVDWRPSDIDTATFQGDFAQVPTGVGSTAYDASTGNFLMRWSRELDDVSDWSVQLYYDHFKIDYAPGSLFSDVAGQNVFDLDTQYHTLCGRHSVISGFGFRNYENYVRSSPGQAVNFNPGTDTFDIISYFLQDTISFADDSLNLTLGCKCEHTDFVGFVYQPAVKLAFTPNEQTSLWASVSRAVRTPAQSNRSALVFSPLGGGQLLRVHGTDAVYGEQALSYEIGIRRQESERFYWDLSAYFCRYDDLIRSVITDINPPFVDATFLNIGAADTYGFECSATYEATDWQRFRGSYSFFRDADYTRAATTDSVNLAGSYPRNIAYLSSSTDLLDDVTFDAALRYVDNVTEADAYLEMDVRLAWALDNGMELALVGQNLLDNSHLEFVDPSALLNTTAVQRGVYAMLSWEY